MSGRYMFCQNGIFPSDCNLPFHPAQW